MGSTHSRIQQSLLTLEKEQSEIGRIQKMLLELMDPSPEIPQKVYSRYKNLIKTLERIQEEIGEVQVDLIEVEASDPRTPELPANRYQATTFFGSRLNRMSPFWRDFLVGVFNLPPSTYLNKDLLSKHDDSPIHASKKVHKTKKAIVPEQLHDASIGDPRQWLEQNEISITKIRPTQGTDAAAIELARMIVSQFDKVFPFIKFIKRQINEEDWFHYDFEKLNINPESASVVIQFSQKLLEHGYIYESFYFKQNRTLRFKIAHNGKILNFFNGVWLELYTNDIISSSIQGMIPIWDRDHHMLNNVSIELNDKSAAEFDTIFGILNQGIVWLEAKSGNFRNHLPKLRLTVQNFKVAPTYAVLIITEDLDEATADSLGGLNGIELIHVVDLQDWLESTLIASSSKQTA